MSNTTTTQDELNVTNDEIQEILANDKIDNVTDTPTPVKKKKNVLCRLLAILLTAAPIVCLCLLPIKLIVASAAGFAVHEGKFIDAFIALFKEDGLKEFYAGVTGNTLTDFTGFKILGIPFLAGKSTTSLIAGVFMYIIPLTWIITAVMMIIAIFSGKKAPAMVRKISFLNFWVYFCYALSVLGLSLYQDYLGKTWDIVTFAIAGGFFLIYLIYAFVVTKKKAIFTFIIFLLSVVATGISVYGLSTIIDPLKTLFADKADSFINGVAQGDYTKYSFITALSLVVLSMIISSIRIATKKGFTFDIVRFIILLAVNCEVIRMTYVLKGIEDFQWYAIGIAVISLLQLLVIILYFSSLRKKIAKEELAEVESVVAENNVVEENKEVETSTPAVEETKDTTNETEVVKEEIAETDNLAVVEETTNNEQVAVATEAVESAEEEMEAVPYEVEGNPNVEVAEAKMAEPVTANNVYTTSGYDFYNSKCFDPFIASLNDIEREQFTNLFILKYKGETKNLPDYVVGGDNREFFQKIFIFLGQYRDRVPDSLLSKMYQFAIRK